ncbi:MAG: TSUP family transporter, partial [Bacteroidota bacterium]
MEIFGYISLFFVGLVLGTFGGGGSILSVPILVYLFSIDAVMASAYSLFIVGTTSLVGTFLKLNVQMVN